MRAPSSCGAGRRRRQAESTGSSWRRCRLSACVAGRGEWEGRKEGKWGYKDRSRNQCGTASQLQQGRGRLRAPSGSLNRAVGVRMWLSLYRELLSHMERGRGPGRCPGLCRTFHIVVDVLSERAGGLYTVCYPVVSVAGSGLGVVTQFTTRYADIHVSGFVQYVLDCPEDPGALDVEDGVPPPRAAPPLLRRVVLNRFSKRSSLIPVCGSEPSARVVSPGPRSRDCSK